MGGVVYLHITCDAGMAQTFPERGMLYLVDGADAFNLAICDPQIVAEELRIQACDRDEGCMVDGCGQNRAPSILLEILRIVRASTEEADSKWRLRNDHEMAALRFTEGCPA